MASSLTPGDTVFTTRVFLKESDDVVPRVMFWRPESCRVWPGTAGTPGRAGAPRSSHTWPGSENTRSVAHVLTSGPSHICEHSYLMQICTQRCLEESTAQKRRVCVCVCVCVCVHECICLLVCEHVCVLCVHSGESTPGRAAFLALIVQIYF